MLYCFTINIVNPNRPIGLPALRLDGGGDKNCGKQDLTMKIILSDLERHLFPERYPFYNEYFTECTDYLRNTDDESDTGIQNISFMIRLTRMSLSIEHAELRIVCNSLFEKIVEHHFDWHKAYNWHELKLFMMYFMFFSRAKSTQEIQRLFSDTTTISLLRKYQPTQNQQKTLITI